MSYKPRLHIETQTFDKSKPDRVELLLQVLDKHKVWDNKTNKFTSSKSENIFNEIFFGLYVAWLTKNMNFPLQGNFCFAPLNREKTLMILPSINKMGAYINTRKNGLEIYKDSILEGLNLDKSECPICLIKHYAHLNIVQVSPKGFNNKDLAFLNTSHEECAKTTQESILKTLSNKILKNIDLSSVLGGYGILLNYPPEIIHDICVSFFAELNEQGDLASIIDDVFMAAILVFSANKTTYEKIATNQSITIDRYVTEAEFDGVGYRIKKPLLDVFEITSLYDSAYHRDIEDLTEKQLPRHFKQKVIRFNSLDTRSEEKKVKFNFYYIHLKTLDLELTRSIEYGVIKHNQKFHLVNLEEEFIKLKELFVRDSISSSDMGTDFKDSFQKFKIKITKRK